MPYNMSFESWAYAHRTNLIDIYKTFIQGTHAHVDYRTFLKYAYRVSDKDCKWAREPWYSESDSEDYDYEYSRLVRTSVSLSSSVESEQPSTGINEVEEVKEVEIERPIEKTDNDGFVTINSKSKRNKSKRNKKKESITI